MPFFAAYLFVVQYEAALLFLSVALILGAVPKAKAEDCNVILLEQLVRGRTITRDDFRVSVDLDPAVVREMIRAMRRGFISHSLSLAAYEPLLAEIPKEESAKHAHRIASGIRQAGRLVAQGKFQEAATLLDDDILLQNTGFHRAEKEVADINHVHGSSEREFAYNYGRGLENPPAVDSTGQVVIPEIPKLDGSPKSEWAMREWIRMASEELSHVAEICNNHSGQGPYISRAMKSDKILRDLIYRDSMQINEKRLESKQRPINFALESDSYAFLIESFGGNFIPTWFGQDSGYSTREKIDRKISPDRQWKKSS